MEQDRDWHYLCPIFATNSVPCKDALGARVVSTMRWLRIQTGFARWRAQGWATQRALGLPPVTGHSYSLTQLGLVYVQDLHLNFNTY